MPASKHTRKANTAKKSRMWDHVRASEIAKGESTGRADMIANGVLKNRGKSGGKRSKRGRTRKER